MFLHLLLYFIHFSNPLLLEKVAIETNDYALDMVNEDGFTRGDARWSLVIYKDLEGYFAICMFMTLKKLFNLRLY